MIAPRRFCPQHHATLYLSAAGDCADTDSVCSTVLTASHEEAAHAHNDNTKKSLTRTSSKKTVRFSTSRHQVYYYPEEDDHRDEEDASCWYTAQDFQRFKAQRVQTVRKLLRQQPHVVRQLEEYYLSGQSSSSSECGAGDVLLLSIPTAWCGLERVSVKALALDKMRRKQQLYEAIVVGDHCRCAACRREVSRDITAPAVRLARALATL